MPPGAHGGTGAQWPAPSSVSYARGLLFVQAFIWGLLGAAAIVNAVESYPLFGTGWTIAVVGVCCVLAAVKAWLGARVPRGLHWTRQEVIVTEFAMTAFAIVLCLVTFNLNLPEGLAFFAGFAGGIMSLVAAAWLATPPARQFFTRGGRLDRRLIAVTAVVAAVVCSGVGGLARAVAASTLHDIRPTRSMMIGTWRSSDGAVLTLSADGTFTESGLASTAGEASTLNIPSQGSGHWRVGPYPAEPAGVVLVFAPDPRVELGLAVERDRSAVIMYYDKGDPDEGPPGQYQLIRTRQQRSG
jgi:hypothetical protein